MALVLGQMTHRMNGMKSQDIVVLLKLVSLQEQEGQVGSGELH